MDADKHTVAIGPVIDPAHAPSVCSPSRKLGNLPPASEAFQVSSDVLSHINLNEASNDGRRRLEVSDHLDAVENEFQPRKGCGKETDDTAPRRPPSLRCSAALSLNFNDLIEMLLHPKNICFQRNDAGLRFF